MVPVQLLQQTISTLMCSRKRMDLLFGGWTVRGGSLAGYRPGPPSSVTLVIARIRRACSYHPLTVLLSTSLLHLGSLQACRVYGPTLANITFGKRPAAT